MCCKFEFLRKKLNDFGYYQPFNPECVPLVEKLFTDLTVTTENLEKYMKLSQETIAERDKLQQFAEPYKCDNAKLIKECNDLHMAFINFKEQHEKIQKEAINKQHEAMRRALHLAERNKQLEQEMKEIDRIALAVEAECNNTVYTNVEKVARLQDRMNESLILIQTLEKENTRFKQHLLELTADLESVKLEKKHLQLQLDREVEDRKRLTEKVNNFTIIENDLNNEIDRLARLTAEQKRKIIDLECQIPTGTTQKNADNKLQSSKTCQTSRIDQTSTRKPVKPRVSKKVVSPNKIRRKSNDSGDKLDTGKEDNVSVENLRGKCCCEIGSCVKNFKELLDKEMEFRQNNCAEFLQRLEEKESVIADLQKDIRTLTTEKFALFSKQSAALMHDDDMDMDCRKPICKRREREIEILRDELKHCEMERGTLKTKIQSLNESTVFNEERIKKAFKDMEEHIRKLEDERRDLVKNEVSARSNISTLESDYQKVVAQLKECQNELNLQRANYNQLKNLHEQTDRALSDAQNKLIRAETELAGFKTRMSDSNRETARCDGEIARLNGDIQKMKMQLSKIDKEKDELLDTVDAKTEKIAELEEKLKGKIAAISTLEAELNELRRKLSKYTDNASSLDRLVHTREREMRMLDEELRKERQLKEAAILENKRLQDDMASVTLDCRDARKELDIKGRQVEDLKRQLQHYVAEVKRAEDLISQKELERNEILDQFRSLSQEANMLETTNHTLENEATHSRVQLSVALDHTSELERKMENQEAIVRSYEKQIAELTTQVASLEIQLKQNHMEQEHFNKEFTRMRDLCVKLDKEKDNVREELRCKDDRRSQVEQNIERLSKERDQLRQALDRETNNLSGVEKLLNEARQELIEQRLLNQDLQSEIENLKTKLLEMQDKILQEFQTICEKCDDNLRKSNNTSPAFQQNIVACSIFQLKKSITAVLRTTTTNEEPLQQELTKKPSDFNIEKGIADEVTLQSTTQVRALRVISPTYSRNLSTNNKSNEDADARNLERKQSDFLVEKAGAEDDFRNVKIITPQYNISEDETSILIGQKRHVAIVKKKYAELNVNDAPPEDEVIRSCMKRCNQRKCPKYNNTLRNIECSESCEHDKPIRLGKSSIKQSDAAAHCTKRLESEKSLSTEATVNVISPRYSMGKYSYIKHAQISTNDIKYYSNGQESDHKLANVSRKHQNINLIEDPYSKRLDRNKYFKYNDNNVNSEQFSDEMFVTIISAQDSTVKSDESVIHRRTDEVLRFAKHWEKDKFAKTSYPDDLDQETFVKMISPTYSADDGHLMIFTQEGDSLKSEENIAIERTDEMLQFAKHSEREKFAKFNYSEELGRELFVKAISPMDSGRKFGENRKSDNYNAVDCSKRCCDEVQCTKCSNGELVSEPTKGKCKGSNESVEILHFNSNVSNGNYKNGSSWENGASNGSR